MKKKLLVAGLATITVICGAVGLSACSCNSTEPTGDNITENETVVSDGLKFVPNTEYGDVVYYSVSCADENITEIIIPSILNGVPVTTISPKGFDGYKKIERVSIPDSVTTIGEYAFRDCTSLESVSLPSSVSSIGEYTFYNCSSLKSIILPDNVATIRNYTFAYCEGLSSVIFGKNLTKIEDCAFTHCNSLKSLNIPDFVTLLGWKAFGDCSGLENVIVSGSSTTVGDDAFSGCENVTSATGPITVLNQFSKTLKNAQVTSAANFSFSNFTYLENIVFPENLTTLQDSAFYACESLKTLTLPQSITSIGNFVFAECKNLESIIIPDGVTSLGRSAFKSCNKLKNITIPNGITSFGDSALSDLTELETLTCPLSAISHLPDKLVHLKTLKLTDGERIETNFSSCANLTKVILPDTLTAIGDYAFYNCHNLTSINIPIKVASIGENAFSYCDKLVEVYNLSDLAITKGSDLYGAVGLFASNIFTSMSTPSKIITTDGGFIYYDQYTVKNLIGYSGTETNVILPETLNGNMPYAIYKYAFYNCKNIESITLSKNVTSIGISSFSDCSNLSSITIPNSVTSIGVSAFRLCSKLTEINFDGTIAQWNAIPKNDGWDYSTGNYTVHCSDGDIKK